MTKLFALALCSFLLAPSAIQAQTKALQAGQPLRESRMTGLGTADKNLSAFKGKPLIINVWASWCGPCRIEAGSLDRLSWYDEGRKFSVIGISTDDYPEAAKGFLAKTNITFPNFIDRKLELEAMLGADRLPLTILVGADGKIISKHYGAKAWDEPEALALVGKAFGFKP